MKRSTDIERKRRTGGRNSQKKAYYGKKLRQILQMVYSVKFLVCLGIVIVACLGFFVGYIVKQTETKEAMVQKPIATVASTPTAKPTATPKPTPKPEEGIYTYLQGPKSWKQRLKWSGEWGTTFYDGGSFGGFGCGLCCIANVYSSLTKYQCTPVDAYSYAKKNTEYWGGGAIAWGYMRQTLSSIGFDCSVKKKPSTYKKFKKDIADSECAIVLVSSYNSTCYWQDTPGHYVTIFLYDEKTEKVFLADSGDPKHNRHWVPLRKIYKSLKTASAWQYLTVDSYDEVKDNWKHKSVKGNWVKK